MPKALLAILDGFGLATNPEVSAIQHARTPFIDSLFESYPHTTLTASGEAVGLPDGQFGNSEVGHLNIGSGRIVWQDISRINKEIREGEFFQNPTLVDAMNKATKKGKVHLMGLFSDGGVHSYHKHLYALLELAKKQGVDNVFVHAFTDGRDTDPKAGIRYAAEFEDEARRIGVGEIASIIGRYYAMDRDNRWERVSRAYQLLVNGTGTTYNSPKEAFETNYADGKTDEFLEPSIINSTPESRIEAEDVVIFFNFRGDRAREITRAFTVEDFDGFDRGSLLNLHYVCFTRYDATFENVKIAFAPQSFDNVLGEVVSKAGKQQLRIAETEKYPHVSFFFNGGVETPFEGEERILIPSPKVATYDLQPEMSAPEVGDALTEALKSEKFDLVILNFANPDMVGHTGIMEAAVKAIETTDQQLKRVIETATQHGYGSIVIADHGNVDCMANPDGSPNTAHTTAPVPFILVNHPIEGTLQPGILADVAPSLLKIMGIDQPKEMTGKPLF